MNELTANKDITQTIEIVNGLMDKGRVMMRACQDLPQGELCIIFTNTKRMADRIQSSRLLRSLRSLAFGRLARPPGSQRNIYNSRNTGR